MNNQKTESLYMIINGNYHFERKAVAIGDVTVLLPPLFFFGNVRWRKPGNHDSKFCGD